MYVGFGAVDAQGRWCTLYKSICASISLSISVYIKICVERLVLCLHKL